MEGAIALVGPVDIEVYLVHRIEVVHRNAVALQSLRRGLRAGHGGIDLALDAGEGVDKEIGRGAGTDTQYRVVFQLGLDICQGCIGHRLFHFILGHRVSLGYAALGVCHYRAARSCDHEKHVSATSHGLKTELGSIKMESLPVVTGCESPMPQSYIKRILDARVYDVARETPIHEASLMSGRLDNKVWLKREDLQPVFSFKLRGAYCKMSRLSEEQLAEALLPHRRETMPRAWQWRLGSCASRPPL